MTNNIQQSILRLLLAATFCIWAAPALAQVPIPSTNTPTLRGGTPINGSAVSGEIGFAALRGSFYTGDANSDFGIELSAPTFARDELPGYQQTLGMDVRAPFRFLVSRFPKANGSFKVGPYFHVGRICFDGDDRGDCDARGVGLGANLGYVADIALPKIFKLIVGIEQQLGLFHIKADRGRDDYRDNFFSAQTYVDLGLEAFWRNMFFTMLINVGAQYGSDRLWEDDRALYRHMFGFGYKFR